ncbi:MAG: chorismate mutase [Rhizobiaceae bacterium]
MIMKSEAADMTASGQLPDEISRCAGRIDEIDRLIVELLLDRFRHSRRIGTIKAKLGAEPFDPGRVRAQRRFFVESCVGGGLNGDMAETLIDSILRQVISERTVSSAGGKAG